MRYSRDMIGYGEHTPDPQWPGNARIAVQIVINYEEGGENSIEHGDAASEAFLSEIIGCQPWPGKRHWNMESIYDYGARAGFWRLHRLLKDVPLTIYGVATALERAPEQVAAMQAAGWEIATHGYKWIDYRDIPREVEAEHIAKAIELHTRVTGERPRGFYQGRTSMNTVELGCEEGGFEYLADTIADDLPYWHVHDGKPQLMVPYTMDANDMRFSSGQGFGTGVEFFDYLRDSFDVLYAEGEAGAPKMMSIGLHCRLAGRPGRAIAVQKFIEHARKHEGVWFATRLDIARHWARTHPYQPKQRPSQMEREEFVAAFGGIYEHSPWIAERVWEGEMGAIHDTPGGLAARMAQVFRAASDEERLGVLLAHPDLAGKLAAAKRLTADSTAEQASAGLDSLTDDERAEFDRLNTAYVEKHGFPFIIAVRDHDKPGIMAAMRRRIDNDTATERAEAERQVSRIGALRLQQILGDN
ncbi:allantoinase PuuE [Paracoccus denitrificans]|jgi:OHCU decarboxylase|uniref:Chitooligosaccharide deacetylase n=1 Tax=Paracoccus denitrificans (strain Pd 1222) TaxID=318586 RepID=A1B8L7_PARDP|nr:allantoinase PuuE [Paracoccus denitrificans]ABL71861.1 polysaccharide deacetylase [Paracoccus denitrificans PD1222]MBB4628026.1 OHCU decarboxylase [Paracoccus denitrificans]MCU7429095.1 allantoinase PuuE [Paracoccus denitrificans]QAR28452.1 allantoinase PuuE [Paracoccus denitrificans]UPV96593.1 allantoinase PuuE [Paracoccus denitrificans]